MKISTRETLRSMGMAAALLIILLFIIHTQLHAEVTGGEAQKEKSQLTEKTAISEFVTVESRAAANNDETMIELRERALDASKDEAILKAAESDVEKSMLLREKPRLLRIFKPQREALIEEIKILSEAEREDRSYWIRVTAKVNGALLRDLLMKNLQDDRVIVVTLEKNLKQPLKRHILEHDLISRIKKKGYAIVDYRTIKNGTVSALVSAIRQGNTEAVRKMGLYYLTNVVVVGFVETKYGERTQEIHSSHATGQVKIHRIGNRKELASLTRHNVKGFGSDEEKSGIDAIRKISAMMVDEALKGLPAKPLQQVKLSLREIDHDAAYQKAKFFVASLAPVKRLSDGARNFREEEAALYVWITGGVDAFVKQIAELKKFVITKVERSEIWLEARKMN
jgi:hypothetical protein